MKNDIEENDSKEEDDAWLFEAVALSILELEEEGRIGFVENNMLLSRIANRTGRGLVDAATRLQACIKHGLVAVYGDGNDCESGGHGYELAGIWAVSPPQNPETYT